MLGNVSARACVVGMIKNVCSAYCYREFNFASSVLIDFVCSAIFLR